MKKMNRTSGCFRTCRPSEPLILASVWFRATERLTCLGRSYVIAGRRPHRADKETFLEGEMSMTTQPVQLAILMLLAVLVGASGAQSQAKPPAQPPAIGGLAAPAQTMPPGQPSTLGGPGGVPLQATPQAQPPIIGGLGGPQMPSMPPFSGASILLTDPVTEFQAIMPQLNLTPAQQTKIKAIAAGRQQALTAADKTLNDVALAFHQAADAGNESAIRTGATRIGQCLGDLQILRVKTAAEMRAVLTPAQAARLQQLKAQAEQSQKQMADSLERMQKQMQQIRPSTPVPPPAPSKK
jgi:hypothetical protein